MRTRLVLIALVLMSLLAGRLLAANGEKILINGAPVKGTPTVVNGQKYVTLSFPVEPESATWRVEVQPALPGGTINVTKERIGGTRPPVRGDHQCERCSGSGECQACYPAGSGKGIQPDQKCPVCDGTGKCLKCSGQGTY